MEWSERLKLKLRAGHRFVVVETTDRIRISHVRKIVKDFAEGNGFAFVEATPLGVKVGDDGSVIFSHGNYSSDFGSVAVDVMRQAYHECGKLYVCVVVPTLNIVPEEVMRAAEIVSVPVSSARERYDVMLSVIKEMGANVKLTDEMVRLSKGLNIEEVYYATKESILLENTINAKVFRDYKIEQLRKFGLNYIKPEITFEHVGGMEFLKDYIRERVLVYFKRPDMADMFGIKAPRGILLTGVGGTGKTWFATALAGEMSLPVVKMNVSSILEKGVKLGEVQLRKILQIIDTLSPLVLFIDEIDQIAMKREMITATRRGLINVLMEWLGDAKKEAFVVGATNLIHQIDPNFLRTGRFDAIFYVPPPDRQSRLDVLKIHAYKIRKLKGVRMNEGILESVADKTEMWVASDLESLVQKAYENAMIDYLANGEAVVRDEHFIKAMGNVMPNMELRKAELKATINGMKMLPQGAVVKDTVEMAEIMVNMGKRRKAERKAEREKNKEAI